MKTVKTESRTTRWIKAMPPERQQQVRAARAAHCRANSRKQTIETKLWRMARSRAIRENLPFTIEVEDIKVPQDCPVLGIPLFKAGKAVTPNSPSLDRIRPTLGYVPGNVVVVSDRANRLKRDATPTELVKLAAFYGLDSGEYTTEEQRSEDRED